MTTNKPLLVASMLALSFVGAARSQAQARDTHYAVVGISNPTHLTIHYSFQWGDGEWQSYSVAPGQSRWHSWRYEYPNQNRSPVPRIRFDWDLSDDIQMMQYDLQAYASPFQDYHYGKQYRFVTRSNGRVLDLVSIN